MFSAGNLCLLYDVGHGCMGTPRCGSGLSWTLFPEQEMLSCRSAHQRSAILA